MTPTPISLVRAALSTALILFSPASFAQQAPSPAGHLRFVLILSRHGVRSPTWTNARLDEYSLQPWPTWPVAPGILTPHGRRLMTLFGQYDRSALAQQGLLTSAGCADVDQVFIDADTDQRTIESGRGLAEGLFPGCNLPVHHLAPGTQDALFHSLGKIGTPDSQLALAAIAGRIGNDPAALLPAYQQPLEAMQQILLSCATASPCPASPRKSLLSTTPSLAAGDGDHLVDLKGPLVTAATFAEDLQLEYLEGMPLAQVGWGHVDEAAMRSAMSLHAASSDLLQRAPYLAQAQASNLLLHILQTLDQARQGKPLPGAIGPPTSKLTILVGHDTNITTVAALLNVHWLINGYQRDDAAPGGALIFELWEQDGLPDNIRISYNVQTPEQMRTEVILNGDTRPARATVFLPGCSSAASEAPCTWQGFVRLVQTSTEERFFRP